METEQLEPEVPEDSQVMDEQRSQASEKQQTMETESADGDACALPAPVMTWLYERRLEKYARALSDLGVEDKADLVEVTDADLENMGMRSLQRRRFRGA
jgi:hypothetical protein